MKTACMLSRGALLLSLGLGCGGAPAPRAAASSTGARAVKKPNESPRVITLPTPEDPAPAAAACRAGDASECARVARLYFNGWGVPRDMVRVAVYGGIACSAGFRDTCALRELAYLAVGSYPFTPGLKAYKRYLDSFELAPDPRFCIELPSRDQWGWAVYQHSRCLYFQTPSEDEPPPAVEKKDESEQVYSACFDDGNVEACRGLMMASHLDEDTSHRLAPLCRRKGELCEFAEGDTAEETAQFYERACRYRSYSGCNKWLYVAGREGRALTPLLVERITAEICLHPENYAVPFSVGEAGKHLQGHDEECDKAQFPLLTASKAEGDQALLRGLGHVPEEIRAADCTGRLYEAYACRLFVLAQDKADLDLSAYRLPEEQRWKERMEVLEHMCTAPPPFATDKKDIDDVCANQKRIEKEYQSFLAEQARKKKGPR